MKLKLLKKEMYLILFKFIIVYYNNMFVDGPVNVVRLEGMDKVIYVFYDFHNEPNVQTRCDDIRSQNVASFLVGKFDELVGNGKVYDFFVEMYPMEKTRKTGGILKDRYVDEIMHLFRENYNFDHDKNVVNKSIKIPNVRMHWADIRNYLFSDILDIVYGLGNYVNNISGNMHEAFLNNIKDAITVINNKICILYELLYKNNKTEKINNENVYVKDMEFYGNYEDENILVTKKLLYKLLNVYNNKNIQQKILHIINNELHNIFIEYFKYYETCIVEIENIKKIIGDGNYDVYDKLIKDNKTGNYNYGISYDEKDKIISFISVMSNKIMDYVVGEIGLYIVDLFLLRRFLDKPYIKNAISYTGAAHSNNYVRLLVKYFGFSVTHCSYLLDDDIDNATKVIMESKDIDELNILFYPKVLIQCSNMEKFPKVFD